MFRQVVVNNQHVTALRHKVFANRTSRVWTDILMARRRIGVSKDCNASPRLIHRADEFLQKHCLAHARSAYESGLAATSQRREQIYRFDACFKKFKSAALRRKRWRRAVNGPAFRPCERLASVERLAQRIEYSSECFRTDRYRDRFSRAFDRHSAKQTFGITHCDASQRALIEVVGDFKNDGSLSVLEQESFVDAWKVIGEFDFDHGAAHRGYSPRTMILVSVTDKERRRRSFTSIDGLLSIGLAHGHLPSRR